MGQGGVGAVNVEALARSLDVTKGSFYWHFKSRSALLEAAMVYWREQGTRRIIEDLERLPDPRDRLRMLFVRSLDDTALLRVEAALMAASAAGDALIGPVYAEVNERRLGYLEALYTELGVADSRTWALGAYAVYLGGVQLAAMPSRPVDNADLVALVDLLARRFMPDEARAG